MAVVGRGNGDIGAHPLAAGFAKRIDALHGETGQVLHGVSLSGHKAQFLRNGGFAVAPRKSELPWMAKPRSRLWNDFAKKHSGVKSTGPRGNETSDGRILAREGCGVKRKDYKILW